MTITEKSNLNLKAIMTENELEEELLKNHYYKERITYLEDDNDPNSWLPDTTLLIDVAIMDLGFDVHQTKETEELIFSESDSSENLDKLLENDRRKRRKTEEK